MRSMSFSPIRIGKNILDKKQPLILISGPCVIESEKHAIQCAVDLKKMCSESGVQLVFKSSYDKANRSSINSFRGPGLKGGLKILKKIKTELDLPILTDIHQPSDAQYVAEVCDILQIPAFLCRQTDLLIAAGKTGKVINVKKAQFMAPWDMQYVIEKIRSTGNEKIILTDRGTSFGYNTLISDMRAICEMQKFSVPVCFDASHSIQCPGGLGSQSAGQTEYIPHLTKAALAAGADLLFIESHPNPPQAKSDAQCVISLNLLKPLISELSALYTFMKKSEKASC